METGARFMSVIFTFNAFHKTQRFVLMERNIDEDNLAATFFSHRGTCSSSKTTWRSPLIKIGDVTVDDALLHRALTGTHSDRDEAFFHNIGFLETIWGCRTGSSPQPYVVIDNRRKATQAAYVDPESLKKSRAVPILAEPHHNISPTSEEDILKFEDILAKKVDMSKVKISGLKPWITKRIYEMLKMEDDVVVEFIFNQLKEKFPDPRKMQINLTGLLNGKHARMFMGELWAMLDSAQNSEIEIPTELMNTNDSLNTTPHPCYEWQINLSSEANKFPTRNCDESCPKTSPTGPKYRKTQKTTRVFKKPRK